MPVTEESLKVSFDILLGEIGGFVGMILGKNISYYKTIIFVIINQSFLGVSLMDLERVFKLMYSFLKRNSVKYL